MVGKKIENDMAHKDNEIYSIYIKSRYLNAIEFGARQTKMCRQKYVGLEKNTKEHL